MDLVRLNRIDIVARQGRWPLPEAMRAAVPDYWRAATQRNPHLWDGRILGLVDPSLDDGLFRAGAVEDDYSAFMCWRDRGFPPIGLLHAFCWALIASRDGAVLYGRMGAQTANAGKVYPPGGSLEPRDVRPDGRVDVIGAIELELAEETGLVAASAQAGELVAVRDGPRISFGRVYRFDADASDLQAEIRAKLVAQAHRELEDMVIVRSEADAERAGAVPYATMVARAFAEGFFG